MLSGWLPKTDFDFARLHEAAHAVVARKLGSRVAAMLVCPDGDGYTISAHRSGSIGLWVAAVTSAAGAVVDRAFRRDSRRSRDDRSQVADDKRAYREATGHEMPDPYASARAILDQDDVYQDVLLLARRLTPNEILSGVTIDSLFA